MVKLFLHCGSNEVGLTELAEVEVPKSTQTWFPIHHLDYVNTVRAALRYKGYDIKSEAHALNNKGLQYFGLMELSLSDNLDYATILGLRNSHNKTFPAAMAVGSHVFVCDNLAFSGEITIIRKHTRFINRDLPQLVAAGIGQLGGLRQTQEERIETYKITEISHNTADHLIMEMLRARIITPQQTARVDTAWRKPEHEVFEERSAWSLFNAATHTLKERGIPVPKRSQALHGIFDSYCKVA